MSKQLYRSTAIVGVMTLISRLMGFARDIIMANLFGVSAATDAFFVAFRIPNFLRRLFAEGAFAQAFVPVLTDYKQQTDDMALRTFIDKTAGTLALGLFVISLFGIIAAPFLITLFAPGFDWQGDQFELAVQMLRITFPYLCFISLTAFAGSILNAFGRFAIPAITPLFLNLSMIAAAIAWSPYFDVPILALSWGVFMAGVVQLAFQWPALRQLGVFPRLRLGWHDQGVRRVIRLMPAAIFSVSVVQVNLLFDTLMASFLNAGSVSWLYYSDRLVEFPLGILGVAIGTVILPHLSSHHATADGASFSRSLDWGLKWVFIVGLPATVGLVMLSRPLVTTLFQYNAFGADDVSMASRSLMTFALGLLAFMLIKVLVSGFTARNDTRQPVRFGGYSVLANIILNLILIAPLAHAGIALATSLAAYLNAALLGWHLYRQRVYRPGPGWGWFTLRILIANAMMAMLLSYSLDSGNWLNWGASQRSGQLVLVILTAIVIYTASLLLTGMRWRHLRFH